VKRFILTGAPGAGKTSVLRALEDRYIRALLGPE
jgi:predicted ATPase